VHGRHLTSRGACLVFQIRLPQASPPPIEPSAGCSNFLRSRPIRVTLKGLDKRAAQRAARLLALSAQMHADRIRGSMAMPLGETEVGRRSRRSPGPLSGDGTLPAATRPRRPAPEPHSAPTKAVVFQCPCGTGDRRRSSRSARSSLRTIFVAARVALMNTSRSGSRSGWLSNQAQRCLRTSGRSRLAACAVFFARAPVPVEARPQRAAARLYHRLGAFGPALRQGDVRPLLGRAEDHRVIHQNIGFAKVCSRSMDRLGTPAGSPALRAHLPV
jgi:hypothetical protein